MHEIDLEFSNTDKTLPFWIKDREKYFRVEFEKNLRKGATLKVQNQAHQSTKIFTLHIATHIFNSHPATDPIYWPHSSPYIEFVSGSNAAFADGCWLLIFVRFESSL